MIRFGAICLYIMSITFATASLEDTKRNIKTGNIPIRGVNLGGWLLAEHWMTKDSPAWKGAEDVADKGEYVTMQRLGHARGDRQFDEHRRTFITEDDFQQIAAAGLNVVRIPIGYWIVGFDHSWGGDLEGWKVYAPNGLDFLDKALRVWAPKHGLLVYIDMHGAKGSQNGNDHSAPKDPGVRNWDKYPENVNNTIDTVTWLVQRYKDDAAFLGIGLLNEPVNQDLKVLKQYYYDSYGRIRNDLKSDCLIWISPLLSQQNAFGGDWMHFMPYPEFNNIQQYSHEWHPYFVWGYEGKPVNEIIGSSQGYKNQITSWPGNWIHIGEWSLAAGSAMNDDELRRYAQAQLDSYSASKGWTFWSWKFYGDNNKNPWSMQSMIQSGFLPRF